MKNIEDARQLAQTMVDLGKAVGRKTVAVLTDMSQPVGTSIGNRLEILEALDGTYHIADEDTAEESDCKGIAAAIQTRVIDEVNRQLDDIRSLLMHQASAAKAPVAPEAEKSASPAAEKPSWLHDLIAAPINLALLLTLPVLLVLAVVSLWLRSRNRRNQAAEQEEAESDMEILIRSLRERQSKEAYEQIKLAGHNLNAMPQAERDFFWVETLVEKSLLVRLPEVSVADLKEAWMAVVRQANLKKHHKIGREELSVREHMGIILRTLQERGGFVRFEALFDPGMGVPGLVVHFLAMLELGREKLIRITQDEAFSPIYIRLRAGESEELLDEAESAALEESGDGRQSDQENT